MGQILKFPPQAAKLGYRRARKRSKSAENPGQLDLFPPASAQILSFTPELRPFERALQLDERGDPRAAEFYALAIEAQDCVADSFCNLGIIESQKGNTAKAFDCFTNSLKHNPRHSEAHYNLGNLYFDVNDFRLSQIHYEIAGTLDPLFANVYYNLAFVQMLNNEPGSAASALQKYQELVPAEEGRVAEELLQQLKKSLAAAKNPRAISR